jgi:arsenate reductase (thioredoxin)
MKILILCTGNSARSQIAEGVLKSLDPFLTVFSAGTNPASHINPYAVEVMKEIGIDISTAQPKSVDKFLNDSFDYVITVCDNAKETCPVFFGEVKNRLHMGFKDPSTVIGSENEILTAFRRTRDEIKKKFFEFYTSIKK